MNKFRKVTKEEAKKMFEEIDTDKNGKINLDEFMKMMASSNNLF